MSFEIFVSAFDNEGMAKIPVAWLRNRLARHVESQEGNIWRISFDDSPGVSELYLDGDITTEGFCVDRPPSDLEFWKFIADVLKDFPCVLYWPTTTEIAVMGSINLLKHLPKSFIEKMGIPFVSTDPERIRQYVWDNS